MPNQATERLDAMMDKVKNLLARADHPNTPPAEADTARAMAERIMVKYKIDEEALIASGDLSINGINVMFKDVEVYPSGSEFDDVYAGLAYYAAVHTGCQAVWSGWERNDSTGELMRVLQMIGYEADIRYAEALFFNARLLFADRMEPKRDPNLTDAENVYRMRSAGMERIRIARIMGWEKGGAKVTRLYKQECERRGEEAVLTGQGNDVRNFREAYAESFRTEFWTRLYLARQAIEAEIQEGGLVLHGREERVKEAMYQRYPHLRPDTTPKVRETKPAKPAKEPKWTKADQRAADRRYTRAAQAGRQAGRKAAQEINIKGQTPKRRLGE